jgi:hypothetical protein
MSGMTIKVHKTHLGSDIRYALVAKAIQYEDKAGRQPKKPFVSQFVIPAGTKEVKRIKCPPGHYRVEVLLPYGDLLNEDVVVAAGAHTSVVLQAGGSQQEWLSWQTLAGVVPSLANVQSAATTTQNWVKRVAEDAEVHMPSLEEIKSSPVFEAVTNAAVGQLLESADPRSSKLANIVKDAVGAGTITWDDVTKAVGVLSEGKSEGALLQHAEKVFSSASADIVLREVGRPSDVGSLWKRLGRSPAPIAQSGRELGARNLVLRQDANFFVWKMDASHQSFRRKGDGFNRWAVVRHDFGTELVRLPFPWVSAREGSRPVSIDVLVDRHAHPDVLERALRRMSYSETNRLRLNLMKVPHHGSRRNITAGLLAIVDCENFALSTNGSHHDHPDHVALARILRSSDRFKTIYFNYDQPRLSGWKDHAFMQSNNFRCVFPAPTQDGRLDIEI